MSAARFEATCDCGTRLTGNGAHRWRHDTKPAAPHTPHPVGTLRQL